MDHVDNNMDDLFRKAGDLYPLKTSESDWDSMLEKLKEGTSGDKNVPASGIGRKRRWTLLLLMIPALIAWGLYFFHASNNSSAVPIKKTNIPEVNRSIFPGSAMRSQNASTDSRNYAASTPEARSEASPEATGIHHVLIESGNFDGNRTTSRIAVGSF